MLFSDSLATARRGILRHKTRAMLTTLGIIIGVGSVVLMTSVGSSVQRYILSEIESFGGNTIEVYPVGLEKFGRVQDSISMDDAEAITRLTSVRSIAPAIFVAKPVQYGREEVKPMVFGTNEHIFVNYGLKLDRGRLLSESDLRGARPVVVISYQTAQDLFGSEDPLGKRIRIGDRNLTVVGVLKTIGSLVLQDLDTPVYVPISIARAMTGQKHVSYISLQSITSDDLARADITDLLRQRHGITNPGNDPDRDDFVVRSSAQAAEIISTVSLGITVFLALVSGISLVVGGIGIMNVMLVSVTERTKEIGLRKAVGAKRRDILMQFLMESILLTTFGGFTGLVGGALIGYLLSRIAERFLGTFGFTFSFSSALLALMMATGTGLAFGIYPARKAAGLHPIEALRKE